MVTLLHGLNDSSVNTLSPYLSCCQVSKLNLVCRDKALDWKESTSLSYDPFALNSIKRGIKAGCRGGVEVKNCRSESVFNLGRVFA